MANNFQLLSYLQFHNLLCRNSIGILKDLVIQNNSRLLELLDSYRKDMIDLEMLIDSSHELILDVSDIVLNDLFSDYSLEFAKQVSFEEREKNSELRTNISFTYGEIDIRSFYTIMYRVIPINNAKAPELIFYDLGSGTGKALFTSILLFDFLETRGVELLSSLHIAGSNVLKKFLMSSNQSIRFDLSRQVRLHHASILDYDWSDGDIVFANSTCFSDKLFDEVSQIACKLKAGTIMITFTRSLPLESFDVLDCSQYKMSWGLATVYIHRRKSNGYTNHLSADNIALDSWRIKCRELDVKSLHRANTLKVKEYDDSKVLELQEIYPSSLKANYSILFEYKVPGSSRKMKFLLRAPSDWSSLSYHNKPMIVYLYKSRDTLSNIRNCGFLSIMDSKSILSIVLAPILHLDENWYDNVVSDTVISLLEDLMYKLSIDSSRVYLTGDGKGCWSVIKSKPSLFAACIPVGIYDETFEVLPLLSGMSL